MPVTSAAPAIDTSAAIAAGRVEDAAQAAVNVPASAGAAETAATQVVASTSASGSADQQTAVAQQTQLLEYARALGHDVSAYQDDGTYFEDLLRAHQQMRTMQPYQPQFQAFLSQAPQFNQWLAEQQRAARAPERSLPQRQPWEPPIARADYLRLRQAYYEADPQTGEVRPRAGAPAAAVQQINEYEQHTRDWVDRLAHNPSEAIGPLVQPIVREAIQQHLANYQETMRAQQIINQHEEWMFAVNAQTKQRVYDAAGNPILTPRGRLYSNFVREADQLGIRGAAEQNRYAMNMATLAQLQSQQDQKTPVTTPGTNGNSVSSQALRAPSVSAGGAAANGMAAVAAQPVKGLALAEAMRAAFKLGGVTDADVERDFRGE